MRNEIIEEAKNRYIQKQKVDLNKAIIRIFSGVNMPQFFEYVGPYGIKIKGTEITLRYDTDKECFIYNVYDGFNRVTGLEVRSMEDLGKCLIIDGK